MMKNKYQFLLGLGALLVGASCQGQVEKEFEYQTTPAGVVITRYVGSGGEVQVPDRIGGEPVVRIASRAFWNRADVSGVKLGQEVQTLEERSFWFCTGLTSFEIPASVREIGQAAFDDCVQLQNFTLDEKNATFQCIQGVLLSRDGKTLFRYPEGKRGTYSVPEGVEVIGEGAFRGCAHLQAVTLSESVIRIENRAFLSCCELKQLPFPKHVAWLGDYALTDCSHVSRLVIPASVTHLGDSVFSWTNGLEGIWFEGDAPEAHKRVIGHFVPNYPPVYYHPSARGWSSQGWRSLRTLPWEE